MTNMHSKANTNLYLKHSLYGDYVECISKRSSIRSNYHKANVDNFFINYGKDGDLKSAVIKLKYKDFKIHFK